MQSQFMQESILEEHMLSPIEYKLLTILRNNDEASVVNLLEHFETIKFSSTHSLNMIFWDASKNKSSLVLSFMDYLIKKGADVNITFNNQTPLFNAITVNNLQVVKLLLKNKGKVFPIPYPEHACSLEEFLWQITNQVNPDFPYPANFFIELCFAFDSKFKNQNYPLNETQLAIKQKFSGISPHPELGQFFSFILNYTNSNKLNANHYWVLCQAFGATLPLLFETIARGNPENLERLLQAGANPNTTIPLNCEKFFYNNNNNDPVASVSPLCLALFLHKSAMVEVLLKYNAKLPSHPTIANAPVNLRSIRSHPFLIQAATHGHVETIRLVCESKQLDQVSHWIKIKGEYQSGDNALKKACLSNQAQIVKLLMSHHCFHEDEWTKMTDDEKNIVYGKYSLHIAASFPGNYYELLSVIEVNREEINNPDKYGRTPLHYAALGNNPEAIDLLFKYEANLYAKDNKGKTIFDYAVLTGNIALLNHLKKEYQPGQGIEYKAIDEDILQHQAYFESLVTTIFYQQAQCKSFSIQFWKIVNHDRIIELLELNLQGLTVDNNAMIQLASLVLNKLDNKFWSEELYILTEYICLFTNSDNRKKLILEDFASPYWMDLHRFRLPLHEMLEWLSNDSERYRRIEKWDTSARIKGSLGNEPNNLIYRGFPSIPAQFNVILMKMVEIDQEIIAQTQSYLQVTPKVLSDIGRALPNLLPLLLINKKQILRPKLSQDIVCYIATFLAEVNYRVKDRGSYHSHWRTVPNLFKALQTRAADVLAQVYPNRNKHPLLEEHYQKRNEFLEVILPEDDQDDRRSSDHWPKIYHQRYSKEILEKANVLVSFEKLHAKSKLKELLKNEYENKNEDDCSKEIKKQCYQLEQQVIETTIKEKLPVISTIFCRNPRIERHLTPLPCREELYTLYFFKHPRCQYYLYPTERENFLRTLFKPPKIKQSESQQPKKQKC